jgi:adenylate cyclase
MLVGILIAAWADVTLDSPPIQPEYARFFNLPTNAVRVGFLVLVGICLTVVVERERKLLVRALQEYRERVLLTGFLPTGIVSEITRPGSRLREGMSLHCPVMFVDLRDSMRITENMTPERIADFLTRFRRRITKVVEEHDGLIEKFAGDGALIIFGVPEPKPDDGRRALACAKRLVEVMEEWNATRDAKAHLSITVSLHAGQCFCGVLGDASRLEFTAIGDAVNVAARLERLAKRSDETLIASREALTDAEEALDRPPWHALGAQLLDGREAPVEVYAFRAASPLTD